MFTLEQIQAAHSKVKSGADFPAYIKDLIALGVNHYSTYVSDGHTEFSSGGNDNLVSAPKYQTLNIADKSNKEQFKKDLKEHQQGKTNYLTFCQISANLGVVKWIVDIQKMTCTYYDKAGHEILIETIPSL